ncbi:hypothetical protein [Actinomyces radicidentis]|uniref:hypothetical protein n=1 Tax=Actinomyces radicidentis TaxID=111015 RepID=UPI0026E05689|nr:hypothetical protein [Actinomyces radicidentis]
MPRARTTRSSSPPGRCPRGSPGPRAPSARGPPSSSCPTNDCLADGRYVVSGWGRDDRDVAPLKGLIETEGTTSELSVGVDVIRLV